MSLHRRQYLARSAAALGTASLAGCLDELADDDPGGDDGGEADVPDRTGERALDRAVGELNNAALALDVGEVDDPDDLEFDPGEPRDHLDTARDHLDTAEAELEDRDDDIEALRRYADVLAALIDVTETIADDSLEADIDAVNEALSEEDSDIETARDILDERTADLGTAADRYDEAMAGLEALSADRLEELSIVDLDEVEAGAERLGAVLDSLRTLGGGYESILDGAEHLERGQDEADERNHEEAEAAFRTAEEAFEAATGTLTGDGGKADAPDGLVSYFETALCQSRNFADAADSFAAASAAAADGDVIDARDHRDEAEDALEEANDCAD
ncbi:hypothetical protein CHINAEXTREME_04805 [Halobiforma lacisalsi AJ5]|uniref:Uncharacterized protein n=1 Tax=Natronobacterium lacisalsi AJ5 TaxID=358396 RepID=M0LLL8_NATLA|nr:hypothetical protein [Halobiforma lacisalsi]APW97129.1 hypothetical protein CHINAEXTREME_04805 [Halobiforma lacisalsi AJ5]EMA34467.1 hypothetical protein C445_08072 [Halobiforma lacisalsi AJ5]